MPPRCMPTEGREAGGAKPQRLPRPVADAAGGRAAATASGVQCHGRRVKRARARHSGPTAALPRRVAPTLAANAAPTSSCELAPRGGRASSCD